MKVLFLILASGAIPVFPPSQLETLISSEENTVVRQLGKLHMVEEGGRPLRLVAIHPKTEGGSHIIKIKDAFSDGEFNHLLLTKKADLKFLSQDAAFRGYMKTERFRDFIVKNPNLLEKYSTTQDFALLGKQMGYITLLDAYPSSFRALLDDPGFLKAARSPEFKYYLFENMMNLMIKSGANHNDIEMLLEKETPTWMNRAKGAFGWK